ncbi:MAG: glycoside hydrolase family 43 protein [Oscillospiraceae bacterium]|nr:glycoside hydrolase family 43 protein [Oscillospiraceae bacterium]
MIKNPVLTGFHPDPSIIYHNETFYIATSTFEYFPGVKITASKDLANWETVCYPLNNHTLLDMRGNMKSCGVWAPCLSWSNGLFYLVFTDVKSWCQKPYKDTPNYITTAKDIKGPWSDPVYINSSGFDPSLFHDDDGRKYFVNMEWDYRKMKAVGDEGEQFSGILVTELDPVTLKAISKPVKVYKGTDRELVEAPHIYKKDGYYYLFTAEGGTQYAHTQTIARSKEIYGEYETHPDKYLICAKEAHKQIDQGKLQKTGHGSIAQAKDGKWWFAFLCGRPLEGTKYCPLGRETSINEIIWENDWPYLKNKTQVADVEFEGYGTKEPAKKIDYDFNSDKFLLDFQTPRTYPKYEIIDGVLRLYGGDSPVSNFSQGVFVRRQTEFSFEVETSFTLHGENFQQMAGLMYRYDERTHYYLRVSRDDDGKPTLGLICMDAWNFSMPIPEIPLNEGKVYMKLCVDNCEGKFSYSTDGINFIEIPYTVDVTTLSDDYADPLGFTGAYVGMQCVDMNDKTAYADYHSFSYTPK